MEGCSVFWFLKLQGSIDRNLVDKRCYVSCLCMEQYITGWLGLNGGKCWCSEILLLYCTSMSSQWFSLCLSVCVCVCQVTFIQSVRNVRDTLWSPNQFWKKAVAKGNDRQIQHISFRWYQWQLVGLTYLSWTIAFLELSGKIFLLFMMQRVFIGELAGAKVRVLATGSLISCPGSGCRK